MKEVIKYYYLRDLKQNRPIVTVCLIRRANEWSKGVAIYNEADFKSGNMPLNKEKGKHTALAYARRGMGEKRSSLPIKKDGTTLFLVEQLGAQLFAELGILYKAQYVPTLTTHEKNLLKL